jgi:hypothetical protein
MKKILFILFISLIAVCNVSAQKEHNNWFFGQGVGLTWNTTQNFTGTGVHGTANATLTGIPTNVASSLLKTNEGCFSMSDSDGNLLFFSDGSTIWNKNKGVMTNGTGLTGNSSSAQSGVILPYPYDDNKYIAVTLGHLNANNLSYSVVDMTQSWGLGAVTASYKNIRLTGQSGTLGESVTTVRHNNKKDFWIVAPGRGTTCYINVWKVTSAGVQTARHSVATVNVAAGPAQSCGYIKFTPDGKHFVWISMIEPFFAYGDFNPSTGVVSNVRVRKGALSNSTVTQYGYGVEFSRNGKYLYLTYAPPQSNWNSLTGLHVFDFNALLATSNPATVAPLRTLLNGPNLSNGVNNHFAAIQMGPDGRLYIAGYSSRHLFVITNPEDHPSGMKIYKLNNVLSNNVMFGLPSFSAPWFKMILVPPAGSEVCSAANNNYKLTIVNGMGLSSTSKITIDFGDGSPGSIITYNSPQPGDYTINYAYQRAGDYTITVTAYNLAGVADLVITSKMKVNTCRLKANPNIRVVTQ